jgi:hypothetical protein
VVGVLELLLLVGGLGGISVVLDRAKHLNRRAHSDAKRLAAENEVLRRTLSDVRATSQAAILTGDPVAHEIIVDRIDNASVRQLEA